MAGVALEGLFKVFFALRNTGWGGRDLATEIKGCPRFVFLIHRSKSLNISYELPDLLLVIQTTPRWHRGAVQSVIDAPEDILISRHLIAIGIFMVRAKLINP